MSETQLTDAYVRSIMPSVFNKYKVRTIFGTNRKSGIFFGRQQPALLVEGDIWDIYPHENKGKKVLIESFLASLSKTLS